MCVPIWTPTISISDSWFIHSYAKIWHFCHFYFRLLDGIQWHIGGGYILILLITKAVGYFSTCLIHWITTFSKFLFEDSVHCLFYFVVFRTCLCGSKLYLCVCMCTDEKTSLNFHVCKSYFTICFIYSVLFSVYIFFKYLFI